MSNLAESLVYCIHNYFHESYLLKQANSKKMIPSEPACGRQANRILKTINR